MTFAKTKLAGLATLCTLAAPTAQAETHAFNLYIAGIKAGTIKTTTSWSGSNYTTKGAVRSTGIVAKIAKVQYDGTARGSITGNKATPKSYDGHFQTKSRNSIVKMSFSGGVPKVLRYSPEREARPEDVNPASQKGAMDLLTSAYVVFRDVPADQLCRQNFKMFDGRRATRLQISSPSGPGDKVTCKGAYSRVAGFSANALKKGSTFPFTLYYEKQSNGKYRLQSFTSKSTVGTAKVVRQ